MNTHDFYMTLGAKSGLGLDGEQGILSGTSNGFKVNVLYSVSKLIITCAPINGMVTPSAEKVSSLLEDCNVSSVLTKGKALYITTNPVAKSVKGADRAASIISSITAELSKRGYEDNSINCESDMDLKGRNVALSTGPNVLMRYVIGILGAALGIAIGSIIIYWLHSISAIFVMMVTTFILLLLVVGGYELFAGPKTKLGLGILFLLLIVAIEVFTRLKTASFIALEVDMVADALALINRITPDININEYIQINRMSIGEIFWRLPLIFNAAGDFLRDLIMGYCEAAVVMFLAVKSYKQGNRSIFGYLAWIWNSIFHR